MDSGLRTYLDKHNAQPIDSVLLVDYKKEMLESTIPEILEMIDMQKKAIAASFCGVSISEIGLVGYKKTAF